MVRARKQTITSLFCSLQQVLVALWNSADENDFLEMIKEWNGQEVPDTIKDTIKFL